MDWWTCMLKVVRVRGTSMTTGTRYSTECQTADVIRELRAYPVLIRPDPARWQARRAQWTNQRRELLVSRSCLNLSSLWLFAHAYPALGNRAGMWSGGGHCVWVTEPLTIVYSCLLMLFSQIMCGKARYMQERRKATNCQGSLPR